MVNCTTLFACLFIFFFFWYSMWFWWTFYLPFRWFRNNKHCHYVFVLIENDYERFAIYTSTSSLSLWSFFFFIYFISNFSGVCLAHMFYNRLKNIDVEAISSCFSTLLHIMAMIGYKAFSITIPYIVILLLLQMVMKYFHDFGIIDIPSMDHLTCPSSVWRNIAFIDQFYPLNERVSFPKRKKNFFSHIIMLVHSYFH